MPFIISLLSKFDPPTSLLAFAFCNPFGPFPQKLRGLQSANVFPTQKEYFNTLWWNKSSDTRIKQQDLYRNNELLAVLPPQQTSYTDHNRAVGSQDTYKLSFVGQNGFGSFSPEITLP